MGKDKEGKFHPPKGKPSGTKTQKGIATTNSETLDKQLELEERYAIQTDADEVSGDIRVRHPNRNVEKVLNRKISKNKKNHPNKTIAATFEENGSPASVEELSPFMSKEEFASLANHTSDCCITVYIPTHRSGVEVNEHMDNIAFKNALQQIESALKQKDFDTNKIASLLKPGYNLLRNNQFWRSLSEGLVVFISEGFFKYIKIPATPAQKILINNSFYLNPLVPVILSKEYFYLLVISKKQAKLYRADNFGMKYIAVKELPNGVEDVVHFEEKDDHNLFRTGSSGAGKGANFHGIGAGKPEEKENISMYLEEVDETLWKEILHDEHVPLVLAGVEYLIPLFKKVSHYKHVWESYLTGNYEYTDEQKLYLEAREIIKPYFQERMNKAKEAYGNQSATARTSSIIEDIIPAAYYGRVAQLFVQKDEQIWGTFDEKNNVLTIHGEQKEDDDSLLDKAVLKTILNGGEVFIIDKEEMPAPGTFVALMRY
jgi:hypothetical protein